MKTSGFADLSSIRARAGREVLFPTGPAELADVWESMGVVYVRGYRADSSARWPVAELAATAFFEGPFLRCQDTAGNQVLSFRSKL